MLAAEYVFISEIGSHNHVIMCCRSEAAWQGQRGPARAKGPKSGQEIKPRMGQQFRPRFSSTRPSPHHLMILIQQSKNVPQNLQSLNLDLNCWSVRLGFVPRKCLFCVKNVKKVLFKDARHAQCNIFALCNVFFLKNRVISV